MTPMNQFPVDLVLFFFSLHLCQFSCFIKVSQVSTAHSPSCFLTKDISFWVRKLIRHTISSSMASILLPSFFSLIMVFLLALLNMLSLLAFSNSYLNPETQLFYAVIVHPLDDCIWHSLVFRRTVTFLTDWEIGFQLPWQIRSPVVHTCRLFRGIVSKWFHLVS